MANLTQALVKRILSNVGGTGLHNVRSITE